MNEHLFIGDTTYPHIAKSTNENICDQLRELSPDLVENHAKQIVFAIDRIEQLERKLAEAQEDAERYRFIRNISDGVIGLAGVPCVAMPNGMSSGYYLNAEHADFAIDAAIQEGKA